jgi:putative endonuclease
MKQFVYILQCSDGSYYVGSTSDPAQRLDFHQSDRGGTYTAQRLPVSLVYQESHATMADARAREKQIKRWSRVKKAALISGDNAALHAAARRRNMRVQEPT